MEKLVKIEGRNVGLKASAGTVRAYRDIFARDIIVDMTSIEREILEQKLLSTESQMIAENIIWLMAKEYDSDIPEIRTWLDQFSPYFVFNCIAHVVMMWRENSAQLNKTRKK